MKKTLPILAAFLTLFIGSQSFAQTSETYVHPLVKKGINSLADSYVTYEDSEKLSTDDKYISPWRFQSDPFAIYSDLTKSLENSVIKENLRVFLETKTSGCCDCGLTYGEDEIQKKDILAAGYLYAYAAGTYNEFAENVLVRFFSSKSKFLVDRAVDFIADYGDDDQLRRFSGGRKITTAVQSKLLDSLSKLIEDPSDRYKQFRAGVALSYFVNDYDFSAASRKKIVEIWGNMLEAYVPEYERSNTIERWGTVSLGNEKLLPDSYIKYSYLMTSLTMIWNGGLKTLEQSDRVNPLISTLGVLAVYAKNKGIASDCNDEFVALLKEIASDEYASNHFNEWQRKYILENVNEVLTNLGGVQASAKVK